jgi:hypothetical protein
MVTQGLIDRFMPRCDVSEYHERAVQASGARTYAAIWDADLAAAWLVKGLLALRSIPAFLSSPAARRPGPRVTLREILRHGFCLLGEDPGREVVLGVTGRFWKPTGNIVPSAAADFRAPLPPGLARAAWNFVVQERGDGTSLLTTETRVACADVAALRSFRRYWLVVGPFSALIRRHMLRAIAGAARGPT